MKLNNWVEKDAKTAPLTQNVRRQEHGTEIPNELESPDTDAAGQKHASQCRVLSEHAGIQG